MPPCRMASREPRRQRAGSRLPAAGALFAGIALSAAWLVAPAAAEGAVAPVVQETVAPAGKEAPVPVAKESAVPLEQPTAGTLAAARITDDERMSAFLDRLMQIESGGRDTARNPRSTALGAFQFIESTFIEVTRRHFQVETASLTPAQVLALRTDRPFARRAAEALTRENIAVLAAGDIAPTFANLRLAYLVGPAATVRLHRSEPSVPVIGILGAAVVQANPFMAGMTARDLVAWSERNVAGAGPSVAAPIPGSAAAALASRDAGPANVAAMAAVADHGAVRPGAGPAKPAPPAIKVECNLGLASCRRWLALAQKAAVRSQVATARPARRTSAR